MTSNIERNLHRHMAPLDGIRALAVLMVFFHHSLAASGVVGGSTTQEVLIKAICSGWVGVDVFFALSGFLITGILLDFRRGMFYFMSFYAKRSLRIWPLYLGFLAIVFIIFRSPLAYIYGDDYKELANNQLWFWLHLQNWYFASSHRALNIPVNQLWSLGVEEQFYLIWPLVVYFSSPRRLLGISLTICVVEPLVRFMLIKSGWSQSDIYLSTFTRLDSLAWGALVASFVRAGYPALKGKTIFSIAILLPVICSVAVLLFDGKFARDGIAWQTIGFSAVAAFTGLVILGTMMSPDRSYLNSVLSSGPLRFIGKYSYSFYVFQGPVLYGVAWLMRNTSPALLTSPHILSINYAMYIIASLGCCVVTSRLSWVLVEERFLKMKRYFERPECESGDVPIVAPRTPLTD